MPQRNQLQSSFLSRALAAALLLGAVPLANAADIVRTPLGGGSTFPIARAVTVPPGFELVFHSGMTPTPLDPKAKEGTPEYWGDTKTQSIAVFKRMEASIKELGYGFKDVVKMTVFLVADPATGKMDFKGFMDAYTQYFGTKEQPNLPSRSAVQVAGLASPGMLVEVEAIFAKKTP